MSTTRIKICGIRHSADLHYAAQLGVDAIGLVFESQSPRCITVDEAACLLAMKPVFLSVVALFVNPEPDMVRSVIKSVPIDYLQFHGSESADFCSAFSLPYIKASAMGSLNNIDAYASAYADTASAIVLDSHCTGQGGGTGTVFDWTKIGNAVSLPLILAGGLRPDNVGEAISRVKPYAVDVSSGVESSRGIKDHQLMRQFVNAVRHADREVEA